MSHTNKNSISEPTKFGPGTWYFIHTMARDATSEDKKKLFSHFMNHVSLNLPCKNCQHHCQQYIKSNPLTPYWTIMEGGKDVGLFKWTWMFHNAVNQRLQKPIVPWSEVKQMYYSDDGVCTSDCGQEPVPTPVILPAGQVRSNVIRATLKPIHPSNYKKTLFKPS